MGKAKKPGQINFLADDQMFGRLRQLVAAGLGATPTNVAEFLVRVGIQQALRDGVISREAPPPVT